MSQAMSRETAEHFYAWLERTVATCDQHGVEQSIHALLSEYPSLPDEGRSWSEIRALAERAQNRS